LVVSDKWSQVVSDYDYRFQIVRRAEVVEIVSRHVERLTGKPLTVLISQSPKQLEEMIVTKKDLHDDSLKAQQRRASALKVKDPSSASTVVVTDQDTSSKFEGFLSKRGKEQNVWRRRYFRLGDENIVYYDVRAKGCINLSQGFVREWKNSRISVLAREAKEPSGPKHVVNILRDAERATSFLEYCSKVQNEGDAKFFLAVEAYRRIKGPGETLVREATSIWERFLAADAPMEIGSIPQARIPVEDEINSKKVTTHTFDTLQDLVVASLRSELLPGYLEHASVHADEEDFTIKTALTEKEKNVESCQGCSAKFSMIKWRNFCQYCNKVMCSACVSRQSALPKNSKYPQQVIRVCDVCHGILNPNSQLPFPFTCAEAQREKPLNLAADTEADRDRWVNATRYTCCFECGVSSSLTRV